MGRPGSHHSPSAPCVAVPRFAQPEFRFACPALGHCGGCDMCVVVGLRGEGVVSPQPLTDGGRVIHNCCQSGPQALPE